ncbi:hypothetical protein QN397_23020 [Variovorax sp. RTB1]|uniref:hypothetical protein n=1 Tax=Variovorax sp. RTB1 TaxID=3048631 RepID=UPI002B23D673|nr:hypothetical protein [Variovorax sp. RTB1]MEB0114159.1 hypothetical protein [Variovorax sp. RTB1]
MTIDHEKSRPGKDGFSTETVTGDQTRHTTNSAYYLSNSQDRITILTAAGNSCMAKRWLADGTIPGYDNAKNFKYRKATLDGISSASALLMSIESDRRSLIIRGRLRADAAERLRTIDGVMSSHVVRRETIFEDQPLHLMMCDIDEFTPTVADPLRDPTACIAEFVAARLPACFYEASYHWQLSGSAGAPKHVGKLKAHVWFWLKTAYTSSQLNAWCKSLGSPIDCKVFEVVQPHYTAAPQFAAGVVDPVALRSGFYGGLFDDSVALAIPAEVLATAAAVRPCVQVDGSDPIAQLLHERDMVKSERTEGGLFIDCPRQTEHSDGTTGATSCLYFPPHTGGFAQGNFVCHHAHCAGRSQHDFRKALGFDLAAPSAAGFDDVVETASEIVAELQTMSRADVLATWATRAAHLPKDAVADVVEAVQKITGIGLRPLNGALADARRDLLKQRVQSDAGARRMIIVEPENSTRQAGEVGALILQHAAPTELVMFADRPSRIVESDPPYAHAHDDDSAKPPPQMLIEAHNVASMRAQVESVAVFCHANEKGPTPTQVPSAIIENLLQLDPANAPRVSGLLSHPIVTPAGEIVASNGRHEGTGLFFHGLAGDVPKPYTRAEATAALQRLSEDVLVGFEFTSTLDASVAISGLFTAVQRRVLENAPGLAVLAPLQSSGKTTLARRLHVLLTGRDLPVLNLPIGDDSEIEKRLLALLLGSPEMICFDNITDGLTVNGGALNAAITSPVFEGRQLGSTRILRAPTATFFVLTGNNLKLGADETTRWLTTELTPATARPEGRRFKHPDVVGHANAIRAGVLRDVVGIVSGYVFSGERIELQGGSRFVMWDKLVRQPLVWAGGEDVVRAFNNNTGAAEHLQALRALVREFRGCFGNESFSARDVVNRCVNGFGRSADAFGTDSAHATRDALEALSCRDVESPRSVGRALSGCAGRVVSMGDGIALRIARRVDANGVNRFALEHCGV